MEDAENHTLNTYQSSKIESSTQVETGVKEPTTTEKYEVSAGMESVWQTATMPTQRWNRSHYTPGEQNGNATVGQYYIPKKTYKEGQTEDKVICRCSKTCNLNWKGFQCGGCKQGWAMNPRTQDHHN